MILSRFKNIYFLRFGSRLLKILGIIFLIVLIPAFTTAPYYAYHWLGTSKSTLKESPETIVLLGGGGMPSQSALMRIWYTRAAAHSFPASRILISMPGDPADSLSTPAQMKKELIFAGIAPERIALETTGTNTRSQALSCARILNTRDPILLVTSPEHMRRAVLSFEKAGFLRVDALPAFEGTVEANLAFTDDELGSDTPFTPDVGKSIQLRYQVWNHLIYEIWFAREMLALGYYKVRGWI